VSVLLLFFFVLLLCLLQLTTRDWLLAAVADFDLLPPSLPLPFMQQQKQQ
jgi:hypothetical protein